MSFGLVTQSNVGVSSTDEVPSDQKNSRVVGNDEISCVFVLYIGVDTGEPCDRTAADVTFDTI